MTPEININISSGAKKTIIVDSTQIASFLECPQLWVYSHKLNLALREGQPKEAMIKGTYGHKLLEIYYKSRAQRADLATAIKEALIFDIDSHYRETNPDEQKFPLSEEARGKVRETFKNYCLLYGTTNDIIPHNADTVEVGFSEKLYEDCEHLFVLEGKIDLLGRMNSTNVIMDHKFQERAYELYKKMVQFRNYSMVTKTQLMIINYVRFTANKESNKNFERRLVSFSSAEHEWWRGELIKIYFRMLHSLESLNEANTVLESNGHNWASCRGNYGYECAYTQLCEERDQEHIKLAKIKQNFVKKPEWKPWE